MSHQPCLIAVDRRRSRAQHVAFRGLALSAFAVVGTLAAPPVAARQGSAFTSEADYARTLFMTPNGNASVVGPLVRGLLAPQDDSLRQLLGGGEFVKVGVQADVGYASYTEGTDDDFRYYINRGPRHASLPLPPGVTLADLPAIVRSGATSSTKDDLAPWATDSRVPTVVAAFEWARAYNLPVTLQLHTSGPQSGTSASGIGDDEVLDLARWFEFGGPNGSVPCPSDQASLQHRRNQMMWDVTDACDPDKDPCSFEPAATWAWYSFATPTLARPESGEEVFGERLFYRDYLFRNLASAIEQIVALANEPRYAGRLVAVAIDPEVHYPDHVLASPANCSSLTQHPFIGDYNPAFIREFAHYERQRYDDLTPLQDTNRDGRTFESDFGADYASSGTTVPTAWEQLDPPRVIPCDASTARTKYWHEWINFRSYALGRFLEEMVAVIADAGMPPQRIFLHQTAGSASHDINRSNGIALNGGVVEYIDEWHQMEVSRGTQGTSLYGPNGVDDQPGYSDLTYFQDSGRYVYDQLGQREDSWGSPEFNPSFISLGSFADRNRLDAALHKAFDRGAHVLWPHAWPYLDIPGFDMSTHRHLVRSTSLVQTLRGNFETWVSHGPGIPWTASNVTSDNDPVAPALYAQGSTGPWYIESPPLTIDADQFQQLAIDFEATDSLPPREFEVNVEFQTTISSSTWHLAKLIARTHTWGQRYFVGDFSHVPEWTGTVTRLRVYPFTGPGSRALLSTLFLPGHNDFSSELHELAVEKDGVGRPQPPTPLALGSLPVNLATLANNSSADAHLRIYGTDPVGTPPRFNDFGKLGNFEYAASATCGGVTRTDVILEPAAQYLGMHKTGRYRRVQLPNFPDLCLSFQVGLQGAAPSGADGVRFRVLLRAENRELATGAGEPEGALFDMEWCKYAWSPLQIVDLSAYAGQVVDLMFETHGIDDTNGDLSVWAKPTIARLMTCPAESARDGFVRGNSTTGVGDLADSVSSGVAALRVGDNASNLQLKAVLSQDTGAVPLAATLLGARLVLRCGTLGPSGMFDFGALQVEVRDGFFEGLETLDPNDFGAPADASYTAGPLAVGQGYWTTIDVPRAHLSALNPGMSTQFRLSFATPTDNDGAADYIGFYADVAVSPENNPVLQVVYY